ncbi:GTP-binding protein Rheb [Acipenser ruthenus]|uniref:GTP-binding protein Rheb n=1 Tax=Acipenser ruthenus TaxID=7906 RepID=A0A444V3F2_ACIRT|nr:GTP-binding protein Rheb [Acipenser ruthenus]
MHAGGYSTSGGYSSSSSGYSTAQTTRNVAAKNVVIKMTETSDNRFRNFEVIQVLHDKLLDMVGKVQVIKPEEGKKLADSWGAAFMESSAKENQGLALPPSAHGTRLCVSQTAVEVFKRIVLEMEKADGNAPSEEKKCAVM